jgi:hypothetical protein
VSAVARYRRIYGARLFRHPVYKSLKRSGRELVHYLLCGPQTNGIGLFHFSPAVAAEDLGDSLETIKKGLADVSVGFGWRFDADARVFNIPTWWKWNPPENANVLKGLLKQLNDLPPCALVEAFAQNLEYLDPTYHSTFVEGCRIRLTGRSRNQEPYQEPFQKPEQEPAKKAAEKNGSNGSRLVPVAKQIFTFTDRDAPIEELLDTFRAIPGMKDVRRAEAIQAINIALSELRRPS